MLGGPLIVKDPPLHKRSLYLTIFYSRMAAKNSPPGATTQVGTNVKSNVQTH